MTDNNATPRHGDDRDSGDLATLKKRGVIDPAGTTCSLCQQEAGDCRPTPITVMSWVPATCDDCYRWLKDLDLFDEQRDKDLFYPDDELIADGGRPEYDAESGEMNNVQRQVVRLSEGENYTVLQRVDNGYVRSEWIESDTVMEIKP